MTDTTSSGDPCEQEARYQNRTIDLKSYDTQGNLGETVRVSYVGCAPVVDDAGSRPPGLARSVIALPVGAYAKEHDYPFAELLYVVEGSVEITLTDLKIDQSGRSGSAVAIRREHSEPLAAGETFSLAAGEAAFLDHVVATFKVGKGPAVIVSTSVIRPPGPSHSAWRPGP